MPAALDRHTADCYSASLAAQAAFAPLQVSYGKSSEWTLEVTVNYMEVANIDTVTTGTGVTTANAFTDGLTLDGTCALPCGPCSACCAQG